MHELNVDFIESKLDIEEGEEVLLVLRRLEGKKFLMTYSLNTLINDWAYQLYKGSENREIIEVMLRKGIPAHDVKDILDRAILQSKINGLLFQTFDSFYEFNLKKCNDSLHSYKTLGMRLTESNTWFKNLESEKSAPSIQIEHNKNTDINESKFVFYSIVFGVILFVLALLGAGTN